MAAVVQETMQAAGNGKGLMKLLVSYLWRFANTTFGYDSKSARQRFGFMDGGILEGIPRGNESKGSNLLPATPPNRQPESVVSRTHLINGQGVRWRLLGRMARRDEGA